MRWSFGLVLVLVALSGCVASVEGAESADKSGLVGSYSLALEEQSCPFDGVAVEHEMRVSPDGTITGPRFVLGRLSDLAGDVELERLHVMSHETTSGEAKQASVMLFSREVGQSEWIHDVIQARQPFRPGPVQAIEAFESLTIHQPSDEGHWSIQGDNKHYDMTQSNPERYAIAPDRLWNARVDRELAIVVLPSEAIIRAVAEGREITTTVKLLLAVHDDDAYLGVLPSTVHGYCGAPGEVLAE